MGCDYHQFFTKQDLDAGDLELKDKYDFKDPSKADAMRDALKVTLDYVMICTIDNYVDILHYWLDEYIGVVQQGEMNYADWAKKSTENLGKVKYCTDEEYIEHFDLTYQNYIFPEATKTFFAELLDIYLNCKDSTRRKVFEDIDACCKKITRYCRDLVSRSNMYKDGWLDIDLRSSSIIVQPKKDSKAIVLNATTC